MASSVKTDSKGNTYVTIEKGDCLSEIARDYKSYISGETINDRVNTLVRLNNIKNADVIIIGQKIYLKLVAGSSSSSTNNTSRAIVQQFGVQSNTDRTLYATWNWSKSNTEHYRVRWLYATGDGVAFVGNDSTTTEKQSTYNAPSNATKVKFKVMPISKKYNSGDTQVSYWTASWSAEETHNFNDDPPTTPNVPSVTIDGYNLTASLDNLDINANGIEFQVIRDNAKVFNTTMVGINAKYASLTCKVAAGSSYKVRCRGYRAGRVTRPTAVETGPNSVTVDPFYGVYGDWTDFSSEVKAPPIGPKQIIELKAMSKTEIHISWSEVKNADSYDIEYATQKRHFDSSSEVKSTSVEAVTSDAYISGLTPGEEYFFRVRSVSDSQKSTWCEIKSIILGSKPISPTTWSSTTTAIVGDPLHLYWVHNTEDGSSQTQAELEIYDDSLIDSRIRCNADASTIGAGDYLYIIFRKTLTPSDDGSLKYYVEYKKTSESDYKIVEITEAGNSCIVYAPEAVAYDIRVRELRIILNSTDEDEKDKTSVHTIDTNDFIEGAKLNWRVRTAGITKEYSDWSIQRTVDIYTPPTLELSVTDSEGNSVDVINQLPFYIKGLPGPQSSTQRPIGYHVSIVSNEFYETTDNIGNLKTVNVGESVYSSFIDDTPASNLIFYKAEYESGKYVRTDDVVEGVVDSVMIEGAKTTYGDQVYKAIIDGEEVYFYIVEDASAAPSTLLLEMSANNIDLENNITYTVIATVSMNSGLTAEETSPFRVSWIEEQYSPNAEVGININDWSAIIKPVCQEIKMGNYLVTQESDKYIRTDTILGDVWNTKLVAYEVVYSDGQYIIDRDSIVLDASGALVNGAFTTTGEQVYLTDAGLYYCFVEESIGSIGDVTTETGEQVLVGETVDENDVIQTVYYCEISEVTMIDDVTLSVYRREFDGTFTEIIKNVENTGQTYAADPHPSLDYARYRIVATSKTTGAISYYDLPGVAVGCNSVVIQWDEEWSAFETTTEDELVKPPWAGSLLKLPYNIDVSDKYNMDVSTVEYIGRKHPVSYYGTQIGSSSTWNAVIPKDDEETLYALRRLAIWPGDVYVREPSGSGYWASISVSFNQKHLDVTIPVTLDIVRVEGGV